MSRGRSPLGDIADRLSMLDWLAGARVGGVAALSACRLGGVRCAAFAGRLKRRINNPVRLYRFAYTGSRRA